MRVRTRTPQIFVSYSRVDLTVVKGLVKLLLGVTTAKVFLDVDSIRLGTKWRGKLTEAIKTADRFVIFWCLHASRSDAVLSEFRTALKYEKAIVPVFLDSTRRPAELDEFQGLDFRKIVRTPHVRVIHKKSRRLEAGRKRGHGRKRRHGRKMGHGTARPTFRIKTEMNTWHPSPNEMKIMAIKLRQRLDREFQTTPF